MVSGWKYSDWRPGGERTKVGDLTFDSTIHCGNGHDFHQVGPDWYRFRARPGLVTYAWRFYFRIDSPGDGREVTIEVADFNHFGQELWQEQATVISYDDEHWADLGLERMEIVPWTPTGEAAEDASIDDGWHPPYGVRYRLRLDAPTIWFATPTPYTLQHSADFQQALARRCAFFQVEEIGRTAYSDHHGYPLLMTRVIRPGPAEGKLRVVVLAGEHPSESAGMYACEGLMEEILRSSDLLADFSFWIVPVVCVDGVAYGRSYHNLNPTDPVRRGLNVGRDWLARTQPETRAIWQVIEQVRPHCLLSLHNGKHRREFEVCAPAQPHLATMLTRLREHLPLVVEHWRPYEEQGAVNPEAQRAGLAEVSLLLETLVLQKLPYCATFKESYRRTGRYTLRALVAGLREIYGKPQLLATREELRVRPLRCRAADFTARLPWFYYQPDLPTPLVTNIHNFEVNGLPLPPGHYDARLKVQTGVESLELKRGDKWLTGRADDGWLVLPSVPVPARILRFDFKWEGDQPPFEEVLITPEGMPQEVAERSAETYQRYQRRTLAEQKAHFANWRPFYERLRAGGFGVSDLQGMCDEIVAWVASRQVLDETSRYYGAIWSEEDKYDARDAAAAAACFTRRYRQTSDNSWLQRAEAARRYAYLSQQREPGNHAHHGGFVHMVHGTWGVNFSRLAPPYPGIDGVDTGIIIHQLCRAAELGLPLAERDLCVLREAAAWFFHNELLPGVCLHHEGATHDCQNANAIGFSSLVRAWHTLARHGAQPPAEWLEAARRGLVHYLQGQEAIGVWPYWFAQVGKRAGAYHFDNIPDHGIGLYHLTRAAELPPLRDELGLQAALARAARWYLALAVQDGDTIDVDYDRRPELGSDICFSGFTWCRFTAAATLLRIARITGELEPWRHLALRLMEHVREKRWQREHPDRAPVVAHARPEAPLATWCQAAEWDAAMLGEMIDDLEMLDQR